MSNAIVTKQGKPSASGEVVDTSAAKVVPPSSEVKTEAAAREVATQKKETQAKITGLAKKMTGGAKAPKAKAAAKPKAASVHRLTTKWASKTNRDVLVGDIITTPTGAVLKIAGRFTKHAKSGLVPMVCGEIVSLPKGATVKAGKGNRMNVAAASCTHKK